MFRAIGTVPIQLNEPLACFLLRPEIFMNPAREFRIGAWATLLQAIGPATSKICDDIGPLATPGILKSVEAKHG